MEKMTETTKNIDLNALAQNLASCQTYHEAANDRVLNLDDYEDHVHAKIGEIYDHVDDRLFITQSLTKLNYLFLIDVPKDMRPTLFRQLNSMIASLMIPYAGDGQVFEMTRAMMTSFKNHLDDDPQSDETFEEVEWDELQKLVYLLGEWEDGLGHITERNFHGLEQE